MRPLLDLTTTKELGIRLSGRESCRVIRFHQGVWIEIGQSYSLPVDSSVLSWSNPDIPGSILAVALRIYELEHPATNLREVLAEQLATARPHGEFHSNRLRPRGAGHGSTPSRYRRNQARSE